jgi:hypothetical protein
VTAKLGGEKAALRYVNQTLAIHQALALLRMHRISPELVPNAVEKAAALLEQTTEPLRVVRERKIREFTPGQREAAIRRRLDAGMTEQAAELSIEWGVRVGPDGQDMDKEVS